MASTQEIFLRALEVPLEDRASFLDQACQGDNDLRRDVESLLKHHQPETLFGNLLPVSERTANTTSNTSWTYTKGIASIASRLLGGQRRRALAWIVAAIVLLSVGYFARKKVQESSETQAREQLRVVLNADVLAVQFWIDGWKKEANMWAENPTVRAQAEKLIAEVGGDPERSRALSDSPKLAEFNALFAPFLKTSGQPQVVLLDREGLRIGYGGRRNERFAAFAIPVLEGETRFSPPSRRDSWIPARPQDSRVIAFVAAPLRDSRGKIFGMLALVRAGDEGLETILNVARMGQTGETYAISPDGWMLSSSRFNNTLQEIGLVPKEPGTSAALTVQVRDPGGDLTEGFQPTIDRTALPLTLIARLATASRDKPPDQQTGTVLTPYRDYRGHEVVGAWKWLPEHDFGVITEVDSGEAFASLQYISQAFYVLFGALGVFVGLTLLSSMSLARVRQREPQVGQYTLSKQIGEGGTSKVYLAHHVLLRRPTAIKILTPSSELPREAIQRFEREVRAACQLTHPNTIEIFDFGRTPNGTFYYAMEYLPGLTLAELVSLDGPLPEGRVIPIMKQVCASLREAHGQGLIHRDIKPQNIMLCQRGGEYDFVKVLDFGLVWNPDDTDTRITKSQNITGTPLYMAPERITKPLEADVRSDIYSVGAVAYYLLSGRPIFPNVNGLELLGQVMHGTPDPLSRLVPSLSPEMDRLVIDSISRDVARRPTRIAAMLEILNSIPNVTPWTQQMARSWWERRAPAISR